MKRHLLKLQMISNFTLCGWLNISNIYSFVAILFMHIWFSVDVELFYQYYRWRKGYSIFYEAMIDTCLLDWKFFGACVCMVCVGMLWRRMLVWFFTTRKLFLGSWKTFNFASMRKVFDNMTWCIIGDVNTNETMFLCMCVDKLRVYVFVWSFCFYSIKIAKRLLWEPR